MFYFTLLIFNLLSAPIGLCVKSVIYKGFYMEQYEVITEDNYTLTIFRIPPKYSNWTAEPVLLVHGLLGTSIDFIMLEELSLANSLYENGYDIWMINARGNYFSNKYDELPDNKKFWDFSFHEIGVFDVPATIDKVLVCTGMSFLHYIGFSQGTTALFIALAERPEYNYFLASVQLLAPIAMMKNQKNYLLKLIAPVAPEIGELLERLGLHSVFSKSVINSFMSQVICKSGAITQPICEYSFNQLLGFSRYPAAKKFLPDIYRWFPGGSSIKQFVHYTQLITSGEFQQFDYKSSKKNYEVYGQSKPPKYNLENIWVPLRMYRGTKDIFLTNTVSFFPKFI